MNSDLSHSATPSKWLTLDAFYDDRRCSMRFPKDAGTDYASIVRPEFLAGICEVADESLGGLGLVVDQVTGIEVGMPMEVVYEGATLKGDVRHVTPRDDGRSLIGFGVRT